MNDIDKYFSKYEKQFKVNDKKTVIILLKLDREFWH